MVVQVLAEVQLVVQLAVHLGDQLVGYLEVQLIVQLNVHLGVQLVEHLEILLEV